MIDLTVLQPLLRQCWRRCCAIIMGFETAHPSMMSHYEEIGQVYKAVSFRGKNWMRLFPLYITIPYLAGNSIQTK